MTSLNCLKCKHYYVTYDPHTPRGCRFYRFISKENPSQVVKRETGSECLAYEQKKSRKEEKVDYNRDDYWS